MLKKIILIVISFSLPWLALADQLTLKENAPKTYVVKKGDTLWDISGIFLDQPWLWPKLWRLNPEINNPHLIYPGDELRLVFDEQGQPMLVKGKPELKWSPRVRTQLKNQNPVSTLPLSTIAPYIKYDSLFTEAQLEQLPYVLGSDRGHKSSIDGFKLYVKGDLELAKAYAIYQKGKPVIDPETNEMLGYQVILAGTGQALRAGNISDKEPSTLYVESSKREIRAGDVVVPVNEGQLLPSYFTMQAADESLRGSIVQSSIDVREFGKLDVVMINRGQRHSVEPGDVFAIKRQSPGIVETKSGPQYLKDASGWHKLTNKDSDYKMPEEALGEMMVFKVYDRVSMALILKTEKPVRLADVVTAP